MQQGQSLSGSPPLILSPIASIARNLVSLMTASSLPNSTANTHAYIVKLIQKGRPFLPGSALCFNSRPSCDGRRIVKVESEVRDVSIHARLATGDPRPFDLRGNPGVSIHARLATGDTSLNVRKSWTFKFQFTPVLRRATRPFIVLQCFRVVSIHARLATGDMSRVLSARDKLFQFTPVLRRATFT